MKQFLRHIFLLVAMFVASTNVWAQIPVYNNGTWYSLYQPNEEDKGTDSGGEIKNYTEIYTPSIGTVYFETKMSKSIIGQQPNDYSLDVSGKTVSVGSKQTSYVEKSASGFDKNITSIKFSYNYTVAKNLTRTVYIRNVKLPLAKHILLAEGTYGTTSKSIPFEDVAIDGTSNAQEVKLRSFLTTGNITVKSNDNAFRIKTSTNTNGDVYAVGANACAASGGSGNAGGSNLGNIENYTVTIYFCPSEAKDYTGTITLTDGTSSATISVSGTGLKKNQSIVWSEKFAADKPSIPVGKEVSDAATATSGLTPIIYSSSDESIIAITNDGKSFKALAAGTATITASQTGDSKWNSTSSSKTITVTEKKIQYIKWTDNLTRFKTGDVPFTMTATAHILVNVETEETQEVPERTALIKYTSANSNIVSVNGKVLTIVGAGETYVTATLEGDDTYERAEITMPVRVRNVTDGCERFVLDAPDEVKYSAPGGNSYTPSSWNAPAGQLSFEARIGNATAVGNIEVEQKINGSWHKIDDFMPGTSWEGHRYTLDRNATQVRFYSNGSFNRFIKNVLVTQATYVEPSVNGVQLAKNQEFILPETAVGVPSENTFELNWSTCDDEGIFLEVDDPTKFKVQPTFISAQSVYYSKTPITVTCIDPSLANTDVIGNIIITYDGNKTYTQPVKCHVKDKLETWLEYHGKDTYSESDGVVANPFTLQDNDGVVLGAKIKLTSSNPDILSIVEVDGEDCLQAHCGGSVVITAYFEGSNKYQSCSLTANITVPYCQREIVWESSYLNFATDENGYIEEKRVLDATINPESEITYQLHTVTPTPFAEIIEEDGKHFVHVFREGHGYLVAIANECSYEGRMYEATYKIKEIRVSGAGACDPNSLLIWGDGRDEPFVYLFSTNSSEQTRIYDLKGLPAEQMTFGAHAATASVNNVLVISFSTESEGDNWIGQHRQEVVSGSNYNWNYSCPVPEGAKRVRFQSEASLTIYFNGVTIPQQTYIRPSVESIEISDAIVNVPFERTFSVDYSNVRLLQWKVSDNHDLGLKVVANQEVNNDCDLYGTYTFTLTGESPYPQENVTETITFYTSAGDVVNIPVTITATLSEPFYFNVQDGDMAVSSNWTYNGSNTHGLLPDKRFPIIVSQAMTINEGELVAYGVTIENGGSVNIQPEGGLTLHAGGFTNVTEDNFEVHNNLEGAGFVRVSKYFKQLGGQMPKMMVHFTTKANMNNGENKDAAWQYIGAPGAETQMQVVNTSTLYLRSEEKGWVRQWDSNASLTPFAGYAFTQKDQPSIAFAPRLVTDNQIITLTYTDGGMKGDNLWANSYMAPIDIKKLGEEDFSGNVDQIVYLYNCGSWNEWNKDQSAIQTAEEQPGRYYAIPVGSARALDATYDQTVIPPMQGVYMVANAGGGSLTLNYEKHVWNCESNEMNRALRIAGKRTAEEDYLSSILRIRLQINSQNSGADRMYLIQDSTCTADYDNGFDAPKQMTDGLLNLYTNEACGKMEISATDNINGIYLGFAAGEDEVYTMTFTSLIGEDLYLYDVEQDTLVGMANGETYEFAAAAKSTNDMRFQILVNPDLSDYQPNGGNGDVTTNLNDVPMQQLWVHDEKVCISHASANSIVEVYTVSGMPVARYAIGYTPCILDLSDMPTGVYMLRLNDQVYKFVCK